MGTDAPVSYPSPTPLLPYRATHSLCLSHPPAGAEGLTAGEIRSPASGFPGAGSTLIHTDHFDERREDLIAGWGRGRPCSAIPPLPDGYQGPN